MQIYFLLLLCVLFWSGNFVLGRFIRLEMEPLQFSFFRWFSVFIILLPYLVHQYKQVWLLLKQHFVYMFVISLLGVAVFNTFVYIGLQFTTATNALLINSATPVFIVFISLVVFRQKASLIQTLGIIISLIGVVYLGMHGNLSQMQELSFGKGDIWILLAAVSWALYSVLQKFKPQKFNVIFPTTVFLGTLMLLPFFYAHGFAINDFWHLGFRSQLVVLYTAIFSSIASFYFWHKGIAEIGAEKTGQFVHFMPVFGILLSYIFLDEHLQLFQVIGFLLVFIGIGFSLFLSKKKITFKILEKRKQ